VETWGVQIAAHEIGNGVYTVLGQMAAERLGDPEAAVLRQPLFQ
jgi:CO/xanthine dehydrogenase Mo-binding subunit